MFTNIKNSVQSFVRPIDVRLVLCVLVLVIFILGAGAPGAMGI
jgi:hypothetical protein